MRSFALLVCNLDRFKLINESLGHRAGDELLQEVARRLAAVMRTADTVARLGGDEFVLIGTSIGDADDAAGLASRVMDATADAGADRHHRYLRLAQHRHRHVSGRRRVHASPACARGCRHAFGQAARPRQLPALCAGNGCRDRGSRSARKRPAPRGDLEPVRALLPAQGRYPDRRGAQRRGLDSLGASHARRGFAGRIHSAGGGMRPHRRNRRMGDPGGMPANAGLADRRRAVAARVGEPVGIAVSRQRAGRQHPQRARRRRPRASLSRGRAHGERRDERSGEIRSPFSSI